RARRAPARGRGRRRAAVPVRARRARRARQCTPPLAVPPRGLVHGAGRGRAFAEGWCTVQDEASMPVARLLDPQPGEHVADCCAAPGTKATHLAELMDDRGSILAMRYAEHT